MIDPRFKAMSIEIAIVVVAFLAAFQFHIVSVDVRNPVTLSVLVIFTLELVRILLRLGRLRRAGIDVDSEGLKSPLLYGINKKLGEFDFRWKNTTQMLDWGIGIVLSVMAFVVVMLIVAALFVR